MKNICRYLLLCTTLLCTYLHADDYENIYAPYEAASFPDFDDAACRSFYELTAQYDYFMPADFEETGLRDQHLTFATGDIDLNYIHALNCCDKLLFGVGYENTVLHWDQNPYFRQNQFQNVIFQVGGMTKRFCHLDLQAIFSAAINADHWKGDYVLYNAAAFGRYCFGKWGMILGVTAWTGLEKTWALPIIGIDWDCTDEWKFNLIFPENVMVVEYKFCNNWSLSVNAKFFWERFRVGRNENLPKGIFQYSNITSDIALNYHCGPYMKANIHAGYGFYAKMKIADSENHYGTWFRLKDTPYFGGAFDILF